VPVILINNFSSLVSVQRFVNLMQEKEEKVFKSL